MAKHSAALKRLLVGLDDPDSQDPAGFGREDVAMQLQMLFGGPTVAGQSKVFGALWAYLHSPDYSRAGLAKRLRAL